MSLVVSGIDQCSFREIRKSEAVYSGSGHPVLLRHQGKVRVSASRLNARNENAHEKSGKAADLEVSRWCRLLWARAARVQYHVKSSGDAIALARDY